MPVGKKCPKCGLLQMGGAACKACGTALDGQAVQIPATQRAQGDGIGTVRILSRLKPYRKSLIIGTVSILVTFAGIYGIRMMSLRGEVKRQQGEVKRQAEGVLQTLRALQSITTAGVTYGEYERRVLDAKIEVDRYLQSEGGVAEIKKAVRDAMDLYVFAAAAWNARIIREYSKVAESPVLDLCPAVRSLRDQEMADAIKRRVALPEAAAGFEVAYSIPELWGCASEKIATIERLLRERL